MILKRLDRIVQGIDIDNHRGHRTGFGEFISRGIGNAHCQHILFAGIGRIGKPAPRNLQVEDFPDLPDGTVTDRGSGS